MHAYIMGLRHDACVTLEELSSGRALRSTKKYTQELLSLGTRAMSSLACVALSQELFSRSIDRPKSSRSAVCVQRTLWQSEMRPVSSLAAMAQQGKVGRGRSQRSLFAARVLAVDGAAPSAHA